MEKTTISGCILEPCLKLLELDLKCSRNTIPQDGEDYTQGCGNLRREESYADVTLGSLDSGKLPGYWRKVSSFVIDRFMEVLTRWT